MKLKNLSLVEVEGSLGVVVKCVEIEKNTGSEGALLG